MAPFSNAGNGGNGEGTDGTDGIPEGTRNRGRNLARYGVPVAVVGVAAATIGLVPALADSGDPNLPHLTARQLVAKIAASDTERLSGTVRITTNLGLPDLGGLGASLASGAGQGGAGGSAGSSADPSAKLTELASGTHTLRIAADGPDRQKVSVLENAAEYSVVHNGDQLWAYDSASDTAYHRTLPEDAPNAGRHGGTAGDRQGSDPAGQVPATPQELADQVLKAADSTTSVTVDGTARVAGRDAYNLVLKPKAASGSTVGAVTIAVDAKTGTPLKFTLTPASGGAAVVDAGFTKVDFSAPDASTFDFKPSKGTKVTEDDGTKSAHQRQGGTATPGTLPGTGPGAASGKGRETIGKGWTAIVHVDSGASALGAKGQKGDKGATADLGGLLSSLGTQVKGDFGSGTLVHTRLVNALITDDGQVYAGAVTKGALLKAAAADSAK